jgi:hypothetical protein
MTEHAQDAQVYPTENQEDVLTGEIAKFGDQKLNIVQCGACDNRHDGIAVNEYGRAPKPFTHWYQCPNTGDPVPIALAMMQAGGAMELRGPVCQALAKAQVAGRFLSAIFWHDTDGKLWMSYFEEKFPTGDYFETKNQKGVLGMLKEQLEKNVGAISQQEMQQAHIPKPLRDLLGNGQQSDVARYQVPRDVGRQIVEEMKNPPQV